MGVKRSWFSAVAEVVQLRPVMEEQLSRWSVYRGGLRLIQELVRDIDCVLPPAGPPQEFKLSSSTDDYQVNFERLINIILTSCTSHTNELKIFIFSPLLRSVCWRL